MSSTTMDSRAAPAGRAAEIAAEQARLLFQGLPVAIAANLVVGALVMVVMWDTVAREVLLGWASVLVVAASGRAGLLFAYRRAAPGAKRLAVWRGRFRAVTALAAAAWGLAGVVLFPPNDPIHQVFLAFVLAGLTTGAVVSLAIDLVACVLFIAAAIAPPLVRFLVEGGPIANTIGVMAVMYLVFMGSAARRIRHSILENVHLRLDATEREQALQRSEELLKEAQQIARLGNWTLNLATGRAQWSEEIYRICGRDPADFEPTYERYFEISHPADVAAIKAAEQRVLESGQRDGVDHRIVLPDGAIRWVRLEGVVERAPDDRPLRFVGTVQDITERKQGEEALRESEERYRVLFAASRDAIMTLAPPSWWFTSGNASAIRLFGARDEQEFISRGPWDVSPARQPDGRASADKAREMIDTAMREGSHFFEWQHCRLDGQEFPATVLLTRVEIGGQEFLQATVRDISEQKKIERLKNEFISTVSHELRTPLTSIRGSLGLLAGGVAGGLPEKARPLIDIAHKNSERLSRLINDLLDIERIASGRMRFDMRVQPLMALVEQAVAACRGYGAQYGVHLEVGKRVAGGEVYVDAERFLQVMANLLSNAAKFSPPGGRVEVEVTERPGTLRVTVSDRGPGVAEEFRDRIFQKFSQADASDTRQKGGTGLGLAISREIVDRMHGHIGYGSRPGGGATFHVDLPPWHRAGARTGPAAGLASLAKGRRLLIVEDEPDVRPILAALADDVAEVDVAQTLAEARAKLALERYALVVLDLALPDGSGSELLPLLQRIDPPPPVIVLSAMELAREHASEVAAALVKSRTSNEELLATIRRALGGMPPSPAADVIHH